jgi:hypothetical protein
MSAFCSRNAHDRNVLARRPQSGQTQMPVQRRLKEQAWKDGEGGLLIFCARATRGLRRPSPGLMAHLGVPMGGRVRKLCAVGDQAGHPPVKGKRAS